MKSELLGKAVAAMREAVQSDTPTMFWAEAMGHVAVLLEHVQKTSSASVHQDPANGCENCAMDLATCDCVEPKPVRWAIGPSRDCATNSKDEDNE